MSAIKDGRYPVELNGKEYHLLFSLNALDAVQDKFGGYDQLDKVFDSKSPTMIKDLKWLLTTLINEGMADDEPELTEKQVGRLIHVGNMQDVQSAIYAAFAYGASGGEETQAGEEADENEEGNAESVQES
ncbi:MAG: hypothetical protein EOM40_10070 [Clostridia bacterium]|nr:hypothetical protein [Clostridia bacterium]